jgi:hypothetical protein
VKLLAVPSADAAADGTGVPQLTATVIEMAPARAAPSANGTASPAAARKAFQLTVTAQNALTAATAPGVLVEPPSQQDYYQAMVHTFSSSVVGDL